MSKDPDKDVVESAGDEPSRRRRRKSGLRVPSDNVPRQGHQASAVSVATSSEDAEAGVEIDLEGPAQSGAKQSTGWAEQAERASSAESEASPGDDGIPSEMDELGDAVPVYQDDQSAARTRVVLSEPQDSDQPTPARQERIGLDDLDSRKTIEMRAVDFPNLDDGSESDDSGAKPAAELDSEDSVDIPIEEDEPAPVEEEPPRKRRRAVTMALSDDDLEELIEPMDLSALGTKMSSGSLLGSKTSASGAGTATAAVEAPAATKDGEVHAEASAAPAVSADEESPATSSSSRPHASQPTPQPVSPPGSPEPSPGAPEPKDGEPPDVALPAAIAALEGKAIASPVEAPIEEADTSDSGEILADDMIEEVDEPDVAEVEEVQETHAPPVPPPAPKAAPKKPPPSPKPDESANTKARSRKGKPWFEEIFDEDYLRTLPFLTPQATQSEALFVADLLEIEPGAQLLDVGCGYGRHAMELAARGYQVVALDMSLPLLLRGADEAQRRGLNINFVHGDMRELSFESQFDGAYCLFSTFGYFDDETNKKTAQGIARALKPGARLVIQILNRDYLIGDLPTRVWWEGDGCVVLEEVDFNYFSSRIESSRSVVFDDGRQLEQEISMRSYSLHEFGKLLHSAGFRVLEISGSMAMRGRFFGNYSREILVIAEKRAPRESTQVSERAATGVPDDD